MRTLSRVARKEHTGENRCWPCTALNLCLVGIGGVAAAAAASTGVGLVVAAVGCAVVWLRGYLLPYTPTVAPRLAARLPRDPFHAARNRDRSRAPDGGTDSLADATGANGSDADGEAVLGSLVDAGVVRPEGEALELDPAFERRWGDETAALRATSLDELAAATLDATPAASAVDTFERRDRTYVILSDGSGDPAAESWLRRPVAIGETAAARALAEAGVPAGRRAAAAHSLGLFLTACPACGGDVTERLAGGCCGPPPTGPDGDPLRALVCADCGVHLHVFDE